MDLIAWIVAILVGVAIVAYFLALVLMGIIYVGLGVWAVRLMFLRFTHRDRD